MPTPSLAPNKIPLLNNKKAAFCIFDHHKASLHHWVLERMPLSSTWVQCIVSDGCLLNAELEYMLPTSSLKYWCFNLLTKCASKILCTWHVINWALGIPRGVTFHMTGYTPAYTESVEKGSFFLTYDFIDVFCKNGIYFAANCTLGLPKWVQLFAV